VATLYDSIDPTKIPANAELVAGYVNGHWPTYSRLAGLFPNATLVSIAVTADADAMVLDVEEGDATPAQAPAWIQRQRARGGDPTIYCSRVSMWPAVQAAVAAAKIAPPHYWIADYTGTPHLVPGSVATQWTDAGPYDISETNGTWPHQPVPPPAPSPSSLDPELELIVSLAASQQDAFNVFVRDKWAQYRTDGLTPPATQYLWAGYTGPWKGSLDLVLACIIDTASAQGHLRQQYAGAV
jgi:hypothetical protein